MLSRRRSAGHGRVVSWGLAITLAASAAAAGTAAAAGPAAAAGAPAAAGTPAWKLRLAIQYLPPATNHSQYDVVLAGSAQTWFLGGSDVGGHGKPEAERIKNGVPRSMALPAGLHSWITAASAPSQADIWAVTFLGGSVLNWNG